jgi:hypothetical protein
MSDTPKQAMAMPSEVIGRAISLISCGYKIPDVGEVAIMGCDVAAIEHVFNLLNSALDRRTVMRKDLLQPVVIMNAVPLQQAGSTSIGLLMNAMGKGASHE